MKQTKRANMARYGKYVLFVCTYLNANVNESLVIITQGACHMPPLSWFYCAFGVCNNSGAKEHFSFLVGVPTSRPHEPAPGLLSNCPL